MIEAAHFMYIPSLLVSLHIFPFMASVLLPDAVYHRSRAIFSWKALSLSVGGQQLSSLVLGAGAPEQTIPTSPSEHPLAYEKIGLNSQCLPHLSLQRVCPELPSI